jgi:parvulin-like peptidyl-prolyl isomerase
VKADIETQLKKQAVNEKTQAAAEQARAALLKAPGTAAEVAKQFNLDLIAVVKANAGTPVPSIGPSPEIGAALSRLKPNEVSDLMVVSPTKVAFIVMNERIAPRPADFADVVEQVRDRFISTESLRLANLAAQKAADQVRGGAELETVAKSMKLEVTKSLFFTTTDSVEGLGPAGGLPDVFNKPVGTVVGPLQIQGRNIVYKVVDQRIPDLSTYAHERDAVAAELKQQKARSMYDLFEDGIMNSVRADGKLKIHQDTVRQLQAAYRAIR